MKETFIGGGGRCNSKYIYSIVKAVELAKEGNEVFFPNLGIIIKSKKADGKVRMTDKDTLERGERVLVDNGISEDEASLVLQALGYVMFDEEWYPEEEDKNDEK